MTDAAKDAKDFSKGKKYKALTRISFGHARPAVEAGQTFNLDDEEMAKQLLATNSITADMKHEEPINAAGGTNAGAAEHQHLPPGQMPTPAPKTASDLRGEAADEQIAGDHGKSAKSAR